MKFFRLTIFFFSWLVFGCLAFSAQAVYPVAGRKKTRQFGFSLASLFIFFGLAMAAPAYGDYYAQGILQSENLLSGADVTDITSFEVTANLPVGTSASVSFSQNRVDFYSSAGAKGGWDSLSTGVSGINISGLTWSGAALFYKLKLETTDPLVTPVISEVKLVYDGEVVPPAGNPRYYEGTLVSTDLLASTDETLNGKEYFGYAISSLPIGTNVFAQFSQDGATFFDSAGAAWGWDALTFGDHLSPETALSLANLNWKGGTSFYYKLKFTTTFDDKTTPTLKSAGLLSFSAVAGSSSSTIRPSAPIAHWKFDEGYGNLAHDEIGGFNGTLTPGASGTNTTATQMWNSGGKFGKALEFDGTDDAVNSGTSPSFDLNYYSISGWFKTSDKSDYKTVISKNTSTNQRNFWVSIWKSGGGQGHTDGSLVFRTSSGGVASNVDLGSGVDNADGQWHHFVATLDENEAKLFVDGELKSSDSSVSTPDKPSVDLIIGNDPLSSDRNFNGLIDEVKIFNYALTAAEVKQEYNQGVGVVFGSIGTDASGNASNEANREYCVPGDTAACNPPIVHLKMDEKTGTIAYDTSGNGNNGTLGGGRDSSYFPVWERGKMGSGLNFDGANDFISVADIDYGPGNELTIEAWVKFSATCGTVCYIATKPASANSSYGLNVHWGRIKFDVNSSWAGYEKSYNDNKWHHAVGVLKGTTITLYVDGKIDGTPKTASPILNNEVLTIGGDDYSPSYKPYPGMVDNFKIYDYARTPAQIAWDYNKGAPIAEWRFDECTGGTLHDEISGNHGTLNLGSSGQTSAGTCTANANTAWYNGRNGKKNASLNFDGTDDYANLGSDSSLDNLFSSGNKIGSISAWIYPESWGEGGFGRILSKVDGSASNGWGLHVDADSEALSFVQGWTTGDNWGGWRTPYNSIKLNEWNHIFVSYDGSSISNDAEFYINGKKQIVTETYTPGGTIVLDDSQSLWIGKRQDGLRRFDGQIDDVKIFNYPLTAEQVKAEFNNGAVRF